jgi:hypothetical protein
MPIKVVPQDWQGPLELVVRVQMEEVPKSWDVIEYGKLGS